MSQLIHLIMPTGSDFRQLSFLLPEISISGNRFNPPLFGSPKMPVVHIIESTLKITEIPECPFSLFAPASNHSDNTQDQEYILYRTHVIFLYFAGKDRDKHRNYRIKRQEECRKRRTLRHPPSIKNKQLRDHHFFDLKVISTTSAPLNNDLANF